MSANNNRVAIVRPRMAEEALAVAYHAIPHYSLGADHRVLPDDCLDHCAGKDVWIYGSYLPADQVDRIKAVANSVKSFAYSLKDTKYNGVETTDQWFPQEQLQHPLVDAVMNRNMPGADPELEKLYRAAIEDCDGDNLVGRFDRFFADFAADDLVSHLKGAKAYHVAGAYAEDAFRAVRDQSVVCSVNQSAITVIVGSPNPVMPCARAAAYANQQFIGCSWRYDLAAKNKDDTFGQTKITILMGPYGIGNACDIVREICDGCADAEKIGGGGGENCAGITINKLILPPTRGCDFIRHIQEQMA